MTAALMLQGTGSDVGKSALVAGLCRLAANRGIRVAPFKPQNMSNNAAVADDGGEIGRAQWLQAVAARRTPSIHMNPVLLKPQSDTGAQVVVHGRVMANDEARAYQGRKPALLAAVMESYARLAASADLVLVEGAGSPAEINLRSGDIANMGFALAADVPVVLVGDIDRGGVIASLVGTHTVLDERDRAQVKGFIINKFRGDVSLFADGLSAIEARTGWPGFGVVPWVADARRLPAEDAVVLDSAAPRGEGNLRIAAPLLSRIANFDDLDPLVTEPGVTVEMIPPGKPLPGDADLVVLLGTKSTIADLDFMRAQGWDTDLAAHVRRGSRVLGLCGGYQMLGREVSDPGGIEGRAGSRQGLGLLDVVTVIEPEKQVRNVRGTSAGGEHALEGYEIHMGRTEGPGCARPMLVVEGLPHGALSADGRVLGCYVHGLFVADGYRRAFLREMGIGALRGEGYREGIERALDGLAAALEEALDVDGLLRLSGL